MVQPQRSVRNRDQLFSPRAGACGMLKRPMVLRVPGHLATIAREPKPHEEALRTARLLPTHRRPA